MSLRKFSSSFHEGSNCCGSCVDLRDFVFFNDVPKSVFVWIVGYALVKHRGGAIGQRAVNNIGVPGDPSDICSTPVDIIFFDIKDIFMRERGSK